MSVRYFAYGSNMEAATFRGRRGIDCTRAFTARLPDWRLVLDKPGMLRTGESYANVVPEPGASVLGVVYEITADELAHVELTEGVLIGNYRRADVLVHALAGDAAPLPATTLTSERRDPALLPSQRYMACLIAGAVEHGLPADYVAFLRGLPACEESAEAQALRAYVDQALRRSR